MIFIIYIPEALMIRQDTNQKPDYISRGQKVDILRIVILLPTAF